MIARNEDEYVELAQQLASDISALQNLRMSLRNLMSKSPLCDGEIYEVMELTPNLNGLKFKKVILGKTFGFVGPFTAS